MDIVVMDYKYIETKPIRQVYTNVEAFKSKGDSLIIKLLGVEEPVELADATVIEGCGK